MSEAEIPEPAAGPSGQLSPDAERQVESLVERFVEQLRTGPAPDRQALAAAHPELAPLLERRLALVEMMYRAARPPERALQLKCPHCGNGIQLVEPQPREVTCQNCGSSFHVEPGATTDYRPGELPEAVGKFRVLELLGRGSFGAVYKARDPELDRFVAVKVPRAGYFASHEEEERFLREARSAAHLNHPGIVPVHEIGHEHGVPYLVSDYVEGLTLADLLTGARPGFREAAELVAQVADALDYAHRQKVIHRDIKPGNILLDRAGRPHLTDFGLARRGEGEITVTVEGQVLGTPAYMAPEQAAGEQRKVDGRSDVYGLGVILYELLTGELPFRGNQRMLLHQVLHDEPRPPRRLNDAIPRDLETICLKAMAKEPGRRYATAGALAEDLHRFLNGEPIVARPVGAAERTWKWIRRRPAVAALLAVSVLALLALAGAGVGQFFHWRLQKAYQETQNQRERADMKSAEAEKQRDRAERQEALVRRLLYLSRINMADRAWHDSQMARMQELLEDLRPAAGQEDLRGFEWYYLWQLRHSELLTLKGHNGMVNSVVFSPDGRRLVSASGELNKSAEVKVWDAQTGQEIMSLKGHQEIVWCVAASADGKRLASASQDRTVKLWDAHTGQEVQTLNGHTGPVRSVAFSPDGRRIVSAGWQGEFHKPSELRVWDAQTGQVALTLKGPSGIASVAFNPDGRRIASGGGALRQPGVVTMWDAETGQEVLSFQVPFGPVHNVAFSPDGKRLVCGSHDQRVEVRDAQTGTVALNLGEHIGWLNAIAFSPDGKRLASTGVVDQTIKVWDAQTGQLHLTINGHTGPIGSLAFSPDGTRLASASQDQTVKVWDAHKSQEALTLWGHNQPVESVAFSPNGRRLASGSWDGTVKVWDAPATPAPAAGFRPTAWMRGHAKPVENVAFSADGTRVASACADQTVKVWDARTGRELRTLSGHTGTVWGVAFSPDGRRILSGGGQLDKPGELKVWDAQTGQEVLNLDGHTATVWGVAFSPDGKRLASASCDHTAKVWDAHTGQQTLTLKGHTTELTSVVFSPDGLRLATSANDHTVKIWDAQTGQEIRTLKGHAGAVTRVAYSPDGKRLATASESNAVKVWDTLTGEEALTLKGHTDSVQSVAFSPDGKRLASGAFDQTVKVWDASLGHDGAVPKPAGPQKHPDEQSGIKSRCTDVETTIQFTNKSGQVIKVFWLDFEGQRQLYQILGAGDSHVQQTHVTHPWLIADEQDNAWYVYVPVRQQAVSGFWSLEVRGNRNVKVTFQKVRNPFGLPDVPDPDGADVQKFAATVKLDGGPTDANAAAWPEGTVAGVPGSIDGGWATRWNGGGAGNQWVVGSAIIKTVGDRVYIFHRHNDNILIDVHRVAKDRLVGRYANVNSPSDWSPWVGRIVDHERIDGQWSHGRWDFRRKLGKPPAKPEEGPPASAATNSFQRGYAAFTRGQYDLAIALYNETLRLDPKHFQAYIQRAAAYFEKGDVDQAIADNTEAIRLQPTYALTYRNRGREYSHKGLHDLAIADFTQALKLEAKNAGAFFERGRSHAQMRDHSKAVADYTEAIRLDPKLAWAHRYRAEAYRALGEEEKAAEDERKARELSK